jgi:hypothetical protein
MSTFFISIHFTILRPSGGIRIWNYIYSLISFLELWVFMHKWHLIPQKWCNALSPLRDLQEVSMSYILQFIRTPWFSTDKTWESISHYSSWKQLFIPGVGNIWQIQKLDHPSLVNLTNWIMCLPLRLVSKFASNCRHRPPLASTVSAYINTRWWHTSTIIMIQMFFRWS